MTGSQADDGWGHATVIEGRGHRDICGKHELFDDLMADIVHDFASADKLAAYFGRSDKLDRALDKFAFAYADQTMQDHAKLIRAIRQKRLKAMMNV